MLGIPKSYSMVIPGVKIYYFIFHFGKAIVWNSDRMVWWSYRPAKTKFEYFKNFYAHLHSIPLNLFKFSSKKLVLSILGGIPLFIF